MGLQKRFDPDAIRDVALGFLTRLRNTYGFFALYAEDCVHRSTPFRPPHRGRQAVRDYVTQAFADEQRIDEVRFGTPVVQGDRACVEYWASFLDQQGTGMTLAGCAMARFDTDGLITEARENEKPKVESRKLKGDFPISTFSLALDYYRKALYLEPNHHETLLQMSLLLAKHGDANGARALKRRAERVQTARGTIKN